MTNDLEHHGCDLYAMADSVGDWADSLRRALQRALEPSCHPDSLPVETPPLLADSIELLEKAQSLLLAYINPQKYHVKR